MKPSYQDIIRQCRHPLELRLLAVAGLLSIVIFLAALGASLMHDEVVELARSSAVEDYRAAHPDTAHDTDDAVWAKVPEDERELVSVVEYLYWPVVLLAPLGLVLLMIFMIGRVYGELRAEGVRIGPEQFPEVHQMWVEMAQTLEMEPVPELYVKNGNGLLNAFATCIPGYRRFGAVYSDILERCLANDDRDALRFVLGHELGHIRMGHVMWWYALLSFSANLPGLGYVLGMPLSRAREYGCDRIGLHLTQDHECKGLLMLAAGKHLYRRVNLAQYEADHIRQRMIWEVIHNADSDHPAIAWRIRALREGRRGVLLFPGPFRGTRDEPSAD